MEELPRWYLLLKDAISFLFTGIGLLLASRGLYTWKKQIKGSKEFDAAYALNLSVLELRDAIKYVRNPGIWPSESRTAVKLSKEKYPELSEEELQKNEHAYVYEIRWEKIITAQTTMESHLLAAEVLWGRELLSLIKPLNEKIRELNNVLRQRFGPAEFRIEDPMKIHDVMYDLGDEKDPFTKEIAGVIEPITSYLKKKMC